MERFDEMASSISGLSKTEIATFVEKVLTSNYIITNALNSIDIGMLVFSDKGDIHFANKALITVNPNFLIAIKNKKFDENYFEKDIATFIKEAKKNKGENRAEFPLELDGQKKFIELKVSRMENSLFLLQAEDVTEKVKKEQINLRQSMLARMTTAGATIAHEINNPLASISVREQLIMKKADKEKSLPSSFVKEHLNVVDEEISRIKSIVESFLFAVRPQNVDFTVCNVKNMLLELQSLVSLELKDKGIKSEWAIPEFINNIRGNLELLKGAILNLIKNAEDALENSKTKKLNVRVWEASGALCIEVSDTGCGIAEKDLVHIYDPYWTTKTNGNGLGLAVVYKTVNNHGGELKVQSKVGKGTSFVIRLPLLNDYKICIEGNK